MGQVKGLTNNRLKAICSGTLTEMEQEIIDTGGQSLTSQQRRFLFSST